MLFSVRVTMVLNYTLILLCFFANILYSHSFSELIGTNFVRKGNYFEVTDGNDTEGIPEGYLEKLENLIQDYKAGKIQYEALNTFSRGLQEYYYFVFAEKKISGFPEIPKIPTSDPISLSNYYNDSIKIVNVSAYGFPGFKQPTIETASSSYQMKAALSFKSDVTILTGNFEIFNSSYFFVYTLKQSVYKEYSRMPRNTLKDIEITNLSLRFSSEELLHTYDSSYPRYAQANEIFVQHFNAAFLKYYLPILFTRSYQSNTKSFMEMHAQYVRTYRKLILSAVSEAVILYSTAKGLNSFELAPVNFTKSVGSQVLEQQYKDIKVDGILNFVNNELINSTMKLFESNKRYQVKLYVTIQLTYADEGEKQAFVSFVINDGGGKNSKKFKIKNIQITSIWVSTLKGDFLDGITFFVEFQLRDFDPTYEFLVRYIGDEITRAFMQTLKESKDLLSEPDINNSRS